MVVHTHKKLGLCSLSSCTYLYIISHSLDTEEIIVVDSVSLQFCRVNAEELACQGLALFVSRGTDTQKDMEQLPVQY